MTPLPERRDLDRRIRQQLGSQRNLLGENPTPELVASLSNETQVTAQTPPTFLFHTQEDKAVPVENSIQY